MGGAIKRSVLAFLAGGVIGAAAGFGAGYLEGVCARVLPAADFEAFDVRPSRIVFEAAVAAFDVVCRFEVPVWERALPEDILVVSPVLLLRSVFEAFDEAFVPVVFLFIAIGESPNL